MRLRKMINVWNYRLGDTPDWNNMNPDIVAITLYESILPTVYYSKEGKYTVKYKHNHRYNISESTYLSHINYKGGDDCITHINPIVGEEEDHLNWIQAAQAIEAGKEVEHYGHDGKWRKTSVTVVVRSSTYRIKPRVFTEGWYPYASATLCMTHIYYSEYTQCWRTLSGLSVFAPILEAIGDKIK